LATSRYVREPVWATSRQLKKWPFFSKKKTGTILPFLAKMDSLLINVAIFGKYKTGSFLPFLAKMGITINSP
jgi:hypothetical protein